jgi:anaerobic dimethyl sulfoxide reductase subunit B (iron-sulfur subunit)
MRFGLSCRCRSQTTGGCNSNGRQRGLLGKDVCKHCLEACPYGAPQFAAEYDSKMQKCDLCLDRWQEGKKPVCVMACPMEALDAGPLRELRDKYGDVVDAMGFTYSVRTAPSVLFRPKPGKERRPV